MIERDKLEGCMTSVVKINIGCCADKVGVSVRLRISELAKLSFFRTAAKLPKCNTNTTQHNTAQPQTPNGLRLERQKERERRRRGGDIPS